MVDLTYTEDELNNYRKGNYQVFIMLPLRYLAENNLSVKDYASFIGKTLSITWKNHQGAPLDVKAKLIAMNYAASLAEKITYEITEQGLEIEIHNWPHPQFMQTLKITKEMITDFNTVWESIGEYIGLKFTQEVKETGYVLKFTK
ncbi:MAG: hypothetical protein FK733_12800 [Asgard group archaeon]|nr:hypothetical protein [Asgard group archaeon]